MSEARERQHRYPFVKLYKGLIDVKTDPTFKMALQRLAQLLRGTDVTISRNGSSPATHSSAKLALSAQIIGDVMIGEHCFIDYNVVIESSGAPIRIEDHVIVLANPVIRSAHIVEKQRPAEEEQSFCVCHHWCKHRKLGCVCAPACPNRKGF